MLERRRNEGMKKITLVWKAGTEIIKNNPELVKRVKNTAPTIATVGIKTIKEFKNNKK